MRYRKNYHSALTWSLLAMVLIIALPLVLGIANAVNNNLAAEEIIAYNMNNENATIAQPLYSTSQEIRIGAVVYDNAGPHIAEQSVFWQANKSWNEFIVQTGANSTDNTSNQNALYFNWNITAQDLINANVNKITIALKGINANTSVRIYMAAVNNGHIFGDGIGLIDINTPFAYKTIYANNTTAITYTYSIDPAILKYAADNTESNNSRIMLQLRSDDPAHDFFAEGQTIYFRIYAEKPHGGIVINGAQFVDFVAELYGIVFIIAAVFATGAVNPTHKHVFGHLYYGLKRYAKIRRKKKYYRARNKLYRTRRPYARTRTYRRRYR